MKTEDFIAIVRELDQIDNLDKQIGRLFAGTMNESSVYSLVEFPTYLLQLLTKYSKKPDYYETDRFYDTLNDTSKTPEQRVEEILDADKFTDTCSTEDLELLLKYGSGMQELYSEVLKLLEQITARNQEGIIPLILTNSSLAQEEDVLKIIEDKTVNTSEIAKTIAQ